MDARPQRPLRSLHIGGDENIAPAQSQSIHQRHKSTSALSTILNPGGFKMAAKRSAFLDVSNTRTVGERESLGVISKNLAQDANPKISLVTEKPSGLLRPAQRPLNPAGFKLASNKENIINTSVPTSAQQQSNIEVPQISKPRAAPKRSNTSIFKDNAGEDQSSAQPQPAAPVSRPVHQSLGPRHHKSQPLFKQEAPVLRRTQSKAMNSSVEVKQDKGTTALPVIDDTAEEAAAEVDIADDGKYANLIEDEQVSQSTAVGSVHDELDRQDRELPPLPLMSEPEEYWDEEEEEEEEEEIYDEQGYATAHSTRSRGDNTTGGATTVLFPKVTNKIKKELELAKEIVENSRTPEEIEDEAWDTTMVAEYGDEIFAYMRELEMKMLPNAHYMDNQAEIQWSMRSVLMDWLIQVHHRFSLLPETLFLCVNYIDRFLSCKVVSLGKLQLVGATAIFIAAKYEEINCPSVGEIVYMVDGGYNVDEILKAERFMLSMLQFELGWPGPMSFLRRISKADDYDLETRTLAKYFLEVTVMDERFVGSPPSYAAAGSHCLARLMLRKGDWSTSHIHYSGYTYAQLKPLINMIFECLVAPEKHHAAVYDKYADKRYKRASQFVQGKMQQGFVIPPVERYYRPSLSPADSYENPIANNIVDTKA